MHHRFLHEVLRVREIARVLREPAASPAPERRETSLEQGVYRRPIAFSRAI
jgi:hypothetical protein